MDVTRRSVIKQYVYDSTTGTLNFRELIFQDGIDSHCGTFGCDNVKCGMWTLTFWTNTLAPS